MTRPAGSSEAIASLGEPRREAIADRVDKDLERVITSWPTLPKYIQRAILTLVNARSISAVSTIGAVAGHHIEIQASGRQAREALAALVALVRRNFDDAVVAPDPTNGWTFDGTTVTLVGQSCAHVMNGDVLNVRVIGGCPTVPPR